MSCCVWNELALVVSRSDRKQENTIFVFSTSVHAADKYLRKQIERQSSVDFSVCRCGLRPVRYTNRVTVFEQHANASRITSKKIDILFFFSMISHNFPCNWKCNAKTGNFRRTNGEKIEWKKKRSIKIEGSMWFERKGRKKKLWIEPKRKLYVKKKENCWKIWIEEK